MRSVADTDGGVNKSEYKCQSDHCNAAGINQSKHLVYHHLSLDKIDTIIQKSQLNNCTHQTIICEKRKGNQ